MVSVDILSRFQPAYQNRGLTLGTSGFTVKVYVAKDNGSYQPHQGIWTTITQTHIAQTKGVQNNPDYSIQFFVSTKVMMRQG